MDRHNVDCGDLPIRGFRAGTSFQYECYEMKTGGRTSAYGYNSGFNSNGGIEYLDRHSLICPNDFLLNRFQMKSGMFNTVTFEFTCGSYNVKGYGCQDRYTDLNELGDGIRYLDRHWAMCRDNEAMRGFQGQTGCRDWQWWGCRSNGFRWRYFCCSADAFDPTPQPVPNPTMAPVADPTPVPTDKPVADPTQEPTSYPIADPTHAPTDAPVADPTKSPTHEPTHEPSPAPSLIPTDIPTPEPTHLPISDPTFTPTLAPVAKPTFEPTLSPTVNPTLAPIADPTFTPTEEPISHPTQKPTFEPTGAPVVIPEPTLEPVANPTKKPTLEPTQTPISEPTKDPSFQPSPSPTAEPISDPTRTPTFRPTQKPTLDPTFEPTINPTENPIARPTHNPTYEPTISPSHKPIATPTLEPSKNPTLEPISRPTFDPTLEPTKKPTTNPTSQPIIEPTESPVSKPTAEPSQTPTAEPTFRPSFGEMQPPPGLDPAEIEKLKAEGEKQRAEAEAVASQPPVVAEPEVIVAPSADAPVLEEKSAPGEEKPKPDDVAGELPVIVESSYKICPFTLTKHNGDIFVPDGCALISVDPLTDVAVGTRSHSAYVCGKRQAQIGIEQLTKAGLVSQAGASYISTIIPGPLTTVTFFINGDFTGPKYTYTPSFHLELTKTHLPNSDQGNDAVKSITFDTTAPPGTPYPDECL